MPAPSRTPVAPARVAQRRLRLRGETGIALIATLMAMALIVALAGMLVLLSISETGIAATLANGTEGGYAAEGALELAIGELAATADWNGVFAGLVRSRYVDGAPDGMRALPDGTMLDVAAATAWIACGRISPCTDEQIAASDPERPWGPNNPVWQPFVFGRFDRLVGAGPPAYVIVWVADDASEQDGNPRRDADDDEPGHGMARVMVHAYGARGVRRVLETVVSRVEGPGPPRVRRLVWRERS